MPIRLFLLQIDGLWVPHSSVSSIEHATKRNNLWDNMCSFRIFMLVFVQSRLNRVCQLVSATSQLAERASIAGNADGQNLK